MQTLAPRPWTLQRVEQRGDEAFGRAIRALRQERGLSQERLGELSKLHRNYIGGVERGELNPTLRTIRRLADALGLRTSELLARAEQETSLDSQRDTPLPL